MTTPKTPETPETKTLENLTRGDVHALMEEGRRLREELEPQFRALRTPSPKMLATRVR